MTGLEMAPVWSSTCSRSLGTMSTAVDHSDHDDDSFAEAHGLYSDELGSGSTAECSFVLEVIAG